MEVKISVTREGVNQYIIGDSLHDCIETAYRNYKGQRVEIKLIKTIGYIDGHNLFVEDNYLDRRSVKEIIKNGDT